jgi:hypothetical protein
VGQLGERIAGDGGADCERGDLPCATIAGARCAALVAGDVEGEGIEGGTDCIGWERGLQRVGERFVGAGGVDCESWVCNARDLRELCMARRHGIA